MKLQGVCVLTTFAIACGESSSGVTAPNCPDVGVPAVTLVALDLMTRQPIAGRAVVIARDGAYADTAAAVGTPPVYAMAYNRSGTYVLTLELAGYQPWRIDGVLARRGPCNVVSVPLAAWLVQQGPAAGMLNAR